MRKIPMQTNLGFSLTLANSTSAFPTFLLATHRSEFKKAHSSTVIVFHHEQTELPRQSSSFNICDNIKMIKRVTKRNNFYS